MLRFIENYTNEKFDVLVVGGLDGALAPTKSATILRIEEDAISVVDQWDGLSVARAGHQAVRIRGGLLAGSVLISGGLDSLRGIPNFAEGAELYMP